MGDFLIWNYNVGIAHFVVFTCLSRAVIVVLLKNARHVNRVFPNAFNPTENTKIDALWPTSVQ